MIMEIGLGALLGVVGTAFLFWLQRTLMPLVNVRLDVLPCEGSPDLVRLVLEVENQSTVALKRKRAELQIDEHDLPPPGKWHPDWQEPAPTTFEVVKTDKLEPREVIHTEVLYRWGSKPAIQCRFSFEYDSWLCRFYGLGPDRHSVIRWFVKTGETPSPQAG
jgi:hypothetical protein